MAEEEKSTYGHLYLLHSVGDSFLQRTNESKNIPRLILGNRNGLLEQHNTKYPAIYPLRFPDWRETGNHRGVLALYWD